MATMVLTPYANASPRLGESSPRPSPPSPRPSPPSPRPSPPSHQPPPPSHQPPPIVPYWNNHINWDRACETLIIGSPINEHIDCAAQPKKCTKKQIEIYANSGSRMKCFAYSNTNETKVYATYDQGPLTKYGPVKKYNPVDEKHCDNKCEGVGQLRRDLHKWEAFQFQQWAPFTSGMGLFGDETMTDYGRIIDRVKTVLDMSSKGSYLPYRYFTARHVESNVPFFSARFANNKKAFDNHQCDAIQSATMLLRGKAVGGQYNASRAYCKGVDPKKIPTMGVPTGKFIHENSEVMLQNIVDSFVNLAWDFGFTENPTEAQKSKAMKLSYDIFTNVGDVLKYYAENTNGRTNGRPNLTIKYTVN